MSDFAAPFLVGVVNCGNWAVMSSFEAVIHQTTANFGGIYNTLESTLGKA